MITVDLHTHTTFSDGALSLNQLVDLCGRAGLDAIAITDHLCAPNNFLGYGAHFLKKTLTEKTWKECMAMIEKEKNRAWREYKMIVYAGTEYTRNTFSHGRNAHLLAIDLKEFVSPNQSEENWLREVRARGALTVVAHPLKVKDATSQTYYIFDRQEIFAPLADIWETANVRTFWRDMLKTPYALLASSDFHVPSKWAAWRTQIPCEKDPEAIKAYVKNPLNPRSFALVHGRKNEFKNQINHDPAGKSEEALCS